MPTAILDQLSVLSDQTRTRLLALLEGRELTVTELCDVLQLPQSTVSRHLKTLADSSWVGSRREATSRYYSLAVEDLEGARSQLWQLVREEVRTSAAAVQDDLRLRQVLARRRARSEEFFASSAHQWDRLRQELFGAHSHLQPLLGWLDSTWVVGDLGCGTGQVSEAVGPFVHRVVAVDSSEEMLDAARRRLDGTTNVEFVHSGLESIPVADGSLDAACVMLVLHHLADPAKVLAEAARVLCDHGRLLVVDMLPHDREEYRNTMGHVWLGFSESQMARLLATAGFDQTRWHVLSPAGGVKGPALFAATACRMPTTTKEHTR